MNDCAEEGTSVLCLLLYSTTGNPQFCSKPGLPHYQVENGPVRRRYSAPSNVESRRPSTGEVSLYSVDNTPMIPGLGSAQTEEVIKSDAFPSLSEHSEASSPQIFRLMTLIVKERKARQVPENNNARRFHLCCIQDEN